MQGDILARTHEINDILKQVHPHFHDHPKNLFFMVLTQSCDLVVRSAGGKCKAPYISIAPVRSLDLVIERHISQANAAAVTADLPVLSDKVKSKASEFLSRLINNNEPGYFFLEGQGTALGSDCAAFLNLSIALKSDLHFAACKRAKVLQLRAEFQAKLGWLVGQLYSRIGTQDWEQASLQRKISGLLREAAIWVPDSTISHLEKEFAKRAGEGVDTPMTPHEISKAVAKAPKRKDAVLEQATKIIAAVLGAERHAEVEKLRKRLEADSSLTSLLR
ncbi:hypothetical protein [Paracoccus haeundaensis]|uniref:Uncharacterized protein n=1 Tax=Paracoccus haeundaensis TaxID=225362 RepID=A0A5C4RAN1_9RHOB|nr:hypothetical protein [Paracoccus haeundaensis]TNH40962.1 hypothetical protein FHD67_02800 [Paracoccus haeundaensis]